MCNELHVLTYEVRLKRMHIGELSFQVEIDGEKETITIIVSA